MKILISTILLLLFPFSSAWALPECKQSEDYWNNCYAKFTYDGGDIYEGEWKDNNRHGQGTYYYLGNSEFSGDKY